MSQNGNQKIKLNKIAKYHKIVIKNPKLSIIAKYHTIVTKNQTYQRNGNITKFKF